MLKCNHNLDELLKKHDAAASLDLVTTEESNDLNVVRNDWRIT